MSAGSTDWSLSLVSGGKPTFLSNSRAAASIFSPDGRHSIVIFSHQIRVYFISTRQCTRAIECNASDVVDVKIDPSNPNHILLFKSYGEVVSVNWKDKINVPIVGRTELEIDTPILSVLQVTKDAYYIISGKKDKKGLPQQRIIHKIDRNSFEITVLKSVDAVTKYAVSLDASKIAFITVDNEIALVDITLVESPNSDGELVTTNISTEIIPFPYKSPVTSVAVSTDSIIAIGTATGTIQVLYGGLVVEKPQRLFKWHNDQVKALQFSADNNYLLSGGLEKVLVFWQLETEKTQFLPRLNGVVEKISIDTNRDDYYQLLLKVSGEGAETPTEASEGTNVLVDTQAENDTHEILILSAVDLISRLSVNSIRPKFANSLKSTLLKTKKKYLKAGKSDASNFDKSKLKYDYTTKFEIHPKSKNLYFPNNTVIQAYDLIKNEQSFIQNVVSSISIGKVKSETKLSDPEISLVNFTQDGEWMCTFDSVQTSDFDNLLSKGDKQYALKFWKYIEGPAPIETKAPGQNKNNSNANADGHWELTTKIVDPHGSNPVIACIPSPASYFNGQAFVTVDSKGSLRLWRPKTTKEYQTVGKNGAVLPANARTTQTSWTLRKSNLGGSLSSTAVDLCWSEDSSLIILAHECSISIINTQTFEPVAYDVPSISGSKIRSLSIVDNNLIVLSTTRLCSFDLLNGKMNDLYAKVHTTSGGKNLIAVDHLNHLVCLVVNYYDNENNDFSIKSKVLIFKPDQIEPVHVSLHNQGISSVRYFNSSFIFVDLNSRIGVIQPSAAGQSSWAATGEKEAVFDLTSDMNNILINAQATADIINNRNVKTRKGGAITQGDESVSDNLEFNRSLDLNTFQPIFENVEGIQIDALFDRIIKVIK